MSIPRFAVKHPITTTMVFLALFGLGLVSMFSIGQELFPEIDLPTAVVITVSPGVGPFDIESSITRPIEAAAAGRSGVTSLQSTSQESVSIVQVGYTEGTQLNEVVPDLREAISTVEDRFPEGTERSEVLKFSPSSLPSLRVNVYTTTAGIDVRRLVDDQVVSEIESIEGVGQVDVFGGTQTAVLVELRLDAISALNLPISRILQVFQGENVSLPGGVIDVGDRQITLRTVGEFEELADIEQVLVGYRGQVPIFLGDVARVRLDQRRQTEFVRANGIEGVRLSIQKQGGFNTVDVNDAVLARLEALRASLPPSIRFEVQTNQADAVRESIGGVTSAAWQGGLLAILVLLGFLRSLRPTLIVTTAIPVAVVATFSLINFGGMTLNMTSLMGITLAIGMFVDNAIVVLESIYRKLLGGMPAEQAAIEGAEEVSRAVVASTLTTVAVFLPMLFVGGLAGMLFQDFSWTIAFSLTISLFSALALVPLLSAKFLRVRGIVIHREQTEGDYLDDLSLADIEVKSRIGIVNVLGGWIRRLLIRMDDTYESAIRWSLRHSATIIISAVVILGLSVGSIFLLGMEFLPEEDEGEFSIALETRVGSTYDFTSGKTAEVEEVIREIGGDEIATVASRVGDGGTNVADLFVVLVDKADRRRTVWEIANAVDLTLAERIIDIDYAVKIEGMSALAASTSGISSPIVIEVQGNDYDATTAYAAAMVDHLQGTPGTRNIRTDFSGGRPELQFRVKRQEAVSLGLSPYEIAATIRTAYNGTVVSRFSTDDDDYDVVMLLQESDRDSLERMSSLFFVNQSGTRIPLENVVELVESRGPVSIARKDRTRLVTVLGELTGELPLNRAMEEVYRRMAAFRDPPVGVVLAYEGSTNEMTNSFSSMFVALMIAVVLVYMVMASQFESLIYPLIVMFSIPFAIIGLVAALLVTNTTFNLLAFVGAILLVGIVVNNAIVLIDYMNTLRKRGMPLLEAIVHGGKTRLKPILMTSLTTILGLVPMSLGIGGGSALRAPLGRAVVGGLLTSTFITLILIPTVLWLVETRVLPFFRRVFASSEHSGDGSEAPAGVGGEARNAFEAAESRD